MIREVNMRSKFYMSQESRAMADRLHAMLHRLQIKSDGEPVKYSWLSWLRWGSPRQKLNYEIAQARWSCDDVVDRVSGFGEYEYDFKDAVMLQSFVIEHFSLMKRISLAQNFFSFDNAFPGRCDPFHWLWGWIVVLGGFFFCCYWMLAWGKLII